jgi:hypothetical protein
VQRTTKFTIKITGCLKDPLAFDIWEELNSISVQFQDEGLID